MSILTSQINPRSEVFQANEAAMRETVTSLKELTATLAKGGGDKARARAAISRIGLEILPGSSGPVTGSNEALAIASEIGYPVIIKAVAGGGGRGMRLVIEASRLSFQMS